jgi:dihydrofolate synthase/folylpolyglutamate synthase
MASNYQQTLDYLYDRLPMFSRTGAAAYKKDLHNTLALLEALGNPHRQFKSIHIAGTNGKGSTSHMLAAVLHHAGYKTGLYTSPHLKDFRERIKVSTVGEDNTSGLQLINESFVIEFTAKIRPLIETIEPSFFEVTVAMAFAYFAAQRIDVAVVETGLGGRLDSTNVITPELSIITNIGWDHMNLLGNTLEKIAFEKAGIIKQRVPVVIGEELPETKNVFYQKAEAMHAQLVAAQQYCSIAGSTETLTGLFVEAVSKSGNVYRIDCDLAGHYQISNIVTAVTACEMLQQQGWEITKETNEFALGHVVPITGLGGRWQVLQRQPYLILDVAHNTNGMEQVLQKITRCASHTHVHVVIGMVRDKDIGSVLRLLPTAYDYYFTNAHLPRALPANELLSQAAVFGLHGKAFNDVNEAIAAALQAISSKDDIVLVCGSVFVVGEVDVNRFAS